MIIVYKKINTRPT